MCNNYDYDDGYYPEYYTPGYPIGYDPRRRSDCECRRDRCCGCHRNCNGNCNGNGNGFYDDFSDGRGRTHFENHRDDRHRHHHRENFIKFREYEQRFEDDSDFDSHHRDREFDRNNCRY